MTRREDYIRKLVEYLKSNLRKGYTIESLKWALVAQGHSKMQVGKAINIVNIELAQQAPVLHTTPEIKYQIIEPKMPKKKSFWRWLFGP